MRKRLLAVLAAVGSLLALGLGQAFAGGTWTAVDCKANSGALQAAINAASPGDTLRISGRCVGNFTVAKDPTLAGPLSYGGGRKAVIDGDASGTVLTLVGDPTVVLKWLTITNGAGAVGRIAQQDGTLTLIKSSVRGNHATRPAVATETQPVGGIKQIDRTINLRWSSVHGNTATGFAVIGGIFQEDGTINLPSSSLHGNRASGGAPFGAAYGGILSDDGPINLTLSSVHGNTATAGFAVGGILSEDSPLTLRRSSVQGNTAISTKEEFGNAIGGVSTDDGVIDLRSSTIARNSASGSEIVVGGIRTEDDATRVRRARSRDSAKASSATTGLMASRTISRS